MLRQSLKGLAWQGRAVDVGALLATARIEPTRRAEEIDIAGFAALARGMVSP